MQRIPVAEREDWKETAAEHGFDFHSIDGDPYWDESAYYQFTLRQIEDDLEDPVEEIKVGYDILKSLNLRTRGVNIIACPSCARQGFEVIETVRTLEDRLAHIAEPISLSIIGCVVNGPGEALMTDLGFTGGGAGRGKMYVSGRPDHNVSNDEMIEHIVEMVEVRAAEMRDERERETAAE